MYNMPLTCHEMKLIQPKVVYKQIRNVKALIDRYNVLFINGFICIDFFFCVLNTSRFNRFALFD